MNEDRQHELLKKLVGYVFPTAEEVGNDGRRFVRRWVVRTEREAPQQGELDSLAEQLVAEARMLIKSQGNSPCDQQAGDLPAVTIVRIGPKHCVVCIESVTAEHATGNDAAISTWSVLRGLDAVVGVEDLEGIPKQHWFPLVRFPRPREET